MYLSYPYPNDVSEPPIYDAVEQQAELGSHRSMGEPPHISVSHHIFMWKSLSHYTQQPTFNTNAVQCSHIIMTVTLHWKYWFSCDLSIRCHPVCQLLLQSNCWLLGLCLLSMSHLSWGWVGYLTWYVHQILNISEWLLYNIICPWQ